LGRTVHSALHRAGEPSTKLSHTASDSDSAAVDDWWTTSAALWILYERMFFFACVAAFFDMAEGGVFHALSGPDGRG
jgi:hypothetical protein